MKKRVDENVRLKYPYLDLRRQHERKPHAAAQGYQIYA